MFRNADPIDNGDASTIWGDYFFLEAINKYMASKIRAARLKS